MKPYSILLICWFAHVNCASINSSVNVIHPEDGTSELIEPLPLPRQPKPGQANATVLVSNIFHKLNGQPNSCFRFSMANLLDHGTLKITPALVSYPGSGNSWMRVMIPPLTGMLTGSYCEKVYPGNGSIGFVDTETCGCTLLMKTHDITDGVHRWAGMEDKNDRLMAGIREFQGNGILLIRNPFKAIISYRNHRLGGFVGYASEAAFSQTETPPGGLSWKSFVTRNIESWEELAKVWILNLKRGGVIYYERLVHDTESELRRLLKMLSISSVDEERMDCVLRHKDDTTFKRKPTKLKNPFNEQQTEMIIQSIKRVQQALKKRNLDPLPVEHYGPYLSKEQIDRL